MNTFSHNDARIVKVGRWNNAAGGVWSGFGGSQLRFRVSGATTLTVNATVACKPAKLCLAECVIDNSPQHSLVDVFASDETFSGARSVTFSLPDTGEHEIILKTNGYFADIFSGASRTVVNSISVNDAAEVLAPALPQLIAHCVGDSWMAADCDWPRLMRPDLFYTYQVATGGMTAADMNSMYAFMASGIAAVDQAADVVVAGYGVNEFNRAISVTSFQKSMTALVDKIRSKQACPIFLVQIPRNINTGKAFDQYGAAMANIAAERADVHYIPTHDIWGAISWDPDTYHLSAEGKLVMADYVGDKILRAMHVRANFLRVKGQQTPGEIATAKHPFRYRGGLKFGCRLKPVTENGSSPVRIMANGDLYTFEN